jgi:ABC-type transport system involved in multi-copper enzyme maturation permease subunit
MNTFASEWRKLVSVRMWIGLAVAAALFTLLNAAVLIVLSGSEVQGAQIPGMDPDSTMRTLYGIAGQASVFALVLGILAITSEYRHQTITATLLATPNRGRLVAAKMGAAAVLSAVIGILCLVLTAASLLVGTWWKDLGPLEWADFAAVAGGIVLGFVCYAVLGVGFGSLVRNQIAAIVAALVWVMLVESLVVSLWPEVGKWLPGGALNGVLQVESFSGSSYLSVLPAALLLVGYAAVFGIVAVRTTLQRDIT